MLPLFAHLLLASSLSPVGAPDVSPKLRAKIESTKAATTVVAGIQDVASAEKAKPQLSEYGKRLKEIEKSLKPFREREPTDAEVKLGKELAKVHEELVLAHDHIFAKQKAVYKLLESTELFKHIEGGLEQQAALRCQNIQVAGRAFHSRYSRLPLTLAELTEGNMPMLAGGKRPCSTRGANRSSSR